MQRCATPAQAAAANVALNLPAGTIGTQIQPDSLWTYEAGTRWRLGGGALTLEASYYHTDWSKVLVQFDTTAVISIANAGNAQIDGVGNLAFGFDALGDEFDGAAGQPRAQGGHGRPCAGTFGYRHSKFSNT